MISHEKGRCGTGQGPCLNIWLNTKILKRRKYFIFCANDAKLLFFERDYKFRAFIDLAHYFNCTAQFSYMVVDQV